MALKAIITLLLFISLSSLSAENTKFSFDKLKDHSTIGFLGDSITQGACKTKNGAAWTDEMDPDDAELGGLYHQYIQLFLSLRYPGKDIWTVNLGHAGAKSDGAIKRLDYDVFPYKLDNTLVHFGMNDFRYFLYLEKKTTPNEKRREAMRSEYVKNMSSLVSQLHKNGSKVALLSPTIYDEFQKSAQKTATGAQAELLKYGELAEQLAQTEKPFLCQSKPANAARNS